MRPVAGSGDVVKLVGKGRVNGGSEAVVEVLTFVGLGVVAGNDDTSGGVGVLRNSGGGDTGVSVTSAYHGEFWLELFG